MSGKRKTVDTTWQIVTYDVWGNSKDGYDVNNAFSRGERIKIFDLRKRESLFIPFDGNGKGGCQEQAIEYLESIGIHISGKGIGTKDSDIVLLTLNFDIPIMGR